MQFAKRVQRIKPSATLELGQKVQEMMAERPDIIELNAGEMCSDTPLNIKAAAIEAIHEGFTRYTAVDGCPELKGSIMRKFERDNQLSYQSSEIIASAGAKQCIATAILSLIDTGDEVLIIAPYWSSYVDMVLMAGGTPVIAETTIEQQFKATPEILEPHISARTKLIIFNNPSNPTGAYYHCSELKAIGDLLLKHPQVNILSDDIYELLLWRQDAYSNLLNLTPELRDRTLIVNGVSKGFSMTGWRLGYAAGPQAWIKQMKKLQGQTTSCPSSISQAAAIEALEINPEKLTDQVDSLHEKHDFTYKKLSQMSQLQVIPASGAFYLFPNVSQAMTQLGLTTDIEFCQFLLEQAGVAVVPGCAFGAPGHVRLSISTSQNNLQKALSQIEGVLQTEKSY